MRLFFSIQFFTVALVALAASAFAAPASETIRGRVRYAQNDQIEVCFYDGYVPTTGEQFALFRNILVAAPKIQSPIRRAEVGAIELSGGVRNGCSAATLLRGEAKAFDWVALMSPGSR